MLKSHRVRASLKTQRQRWGDKAERVYDLALIAYDVFQVQNNPSLPFYILYIPIVTICRNVVFRL